MLLATVEVGFDPFQKYGGVSASIQLDAGCLVVIQHPVTTEYEKSQSHVIETLYAVRDLGLPTLWLWPNIDVGSAGMFRGIRAFCELERPANIYFFKNMEATDFLRLVYNSLCIVGNSSVAIRECSFLGVPAVNIGTRQIDRERGCNVIDVDYNRDQIKTDVPFIGRPGVWHNILKLFLFSPIL